MLEFISVISNLIGAVSVFLMVLFVWRYGPAIGSGLRRAVDAAVVIGLAHDGSHRRFARRLIEGTLEIESEFDLPLLIAGPSAARKRGRHRASDRRVSARDRGYDVVYFARKHGISRHEAERIIKRVGNDRQKLNRAAERAKTRRGEAW
jgi:hypothetical protein